MPEASNEPPPWVPNLPVGDPERFLGHPDLDRGVALFNAGRFWDAHEAWEEAWMPVRHDADSGFFKGLIQVAAGCHHHQRQNVVGAISKWRTGADYLRPSLPAAHGLLLGPLVAQVDACREALELAGWARLTMPRIIEAG